MMQYDILIVGAGPGGSAAAISLAMNGWKVLLLDKATFPRDKVCGDMISPRSQRVLQALGCSPAVQAASPNAVTSAAFFLDGKRIMTGFVPRLPGLTHYGYVLPRMSFDDILFRRAQAVGVQTIEACDVRDVLITAQGVTLNAVSGGRPCSFQGRLVLAADGAHSIVARKLGIPDKQTRSRHGAIALRAYYQGVTGDQSRVDIFFNREFFPGYAWIFPLGAHRANVGLGIILNNGAEGSAHGGKNLRRDFAHWLQNDPQVQARLGSATLEGHIVGWPLNTYSASAHGYRTYAERVLFIGDAAHMVDPLNGEGIHTALESARVAAWVADKALKAGDFSARFLSRYERAWQSQFDLDLRVADLYVTAAQNPRLTGLWLSTLKLVAEVASRDKEYAATVTGVLAGVIPARRTIAPTFIAKTALHTPHFCIRQLRQVGFRLGRRRGLSGLMSNLVKQPRPQYEHQPVMSTSKSQTHQGWGSGRWAREIASKGLGVLSAATLLWAQGAARWVRSLQRRKYKR